MIFSEKPKKWQWIVLICILLPYWMTMHYSDNLGIMATTAGLCGAVKEYGLKGLITSAVLPYGFILQWICALWTLPSYLLYEWMGIEYDIMGNMIYFKLLEVVFYGLAAVYIKKIGRIISDQEATGDWIAFFFCSSMIVVLPVFHIAQIDIIYLSITIMGIYYYFKNKRAGFLICFFLAIPMKYLAILFFMPLVLLHEKRVRYIIAEGFLGCCGIGLNVIFSRFKVLANETTGFMNQISQNVFMGESVAVEEKIDNTSDFTNFFNEQSLFICLFVILLIWAYMQAEKADSQQFRKNAIWVLLAVGLSFCLTTQISPYWIILLAPFLILAVLTNERFRFLNLLFEQVISLGALYVYLIEADWVFGGYHTFDYLLFSKIPQLTGRLSSLAETYSLLNARRFLMRWGLDGLTPYACALVIGCAVAMLIINYPYAKWRTGLEELELKGRALFWTGNLRLVIMAGWFVMMFIVIYRLV